MAEIKVLNEVGATVVINGEERESLVVDYGSTVTWSVSKEGYVTQEGSQEVYEDTVLPVVLKRETYEITFVVSPSGSTLTVGLTDDSGLHEQEYHTVEDREEVNIVAKWGDEISWSCSKSGYVPQSDNFTATGDKTVNVTLEEEVVNPDRTIVFDVSPQEAKLTVNGEEMQDRGTYPLTAKDGDVLEWSCECDGYVSQSGTHTVDGDATIEVVLEENGDQYTLELTDTGTVPWSGESSHIVRWSQPGCKKYLYELSASTTLGSVKSVTDIGDPYDAGEINGEIVLNIPAKTTTGEKTGVLTVYGYDKNGDHVVTATVGLLQEEGPEIEYPTNVVGTNGTSFNADSLALSGEREYTFRIRTSEYVERVHISPIPAYGDHGYGYEYGISSVTLNGVTVGTSGGSVSVEGGKEYDVTVKFHNYHTNANTGANPVTGAAYACEYSIYITPSYGEYTGSEQEFVIYTSNASAGPVTLNTSNGIDDVTE